MASAHPNAMADGTDPPGIPLHNIVPNGDVILEVNEGVTTQKFRVSSQILRLLSEPFGAMFGPHFLEGNKLLRLSPGEPVTVKLPEDDAEGMGVLLNLLHLRKTSVDPSKLSWQLIAQVAILCDKYFVAECLQPYLETWLSSNDNDKTVSGDANALALSYAFLDHERFYKASQSFLIHSSKKEILQNRDTPEDEVDETGEKLFDILPDTLVDKLDSKREASIRSFHLKIEETIQPYLEDSDLCMTFGDRKKRVCDKPHLIAWIFSQLYTLKLWPLSNLDLDISLEHATEALIQYEPYPMAQEGITCQCATEREIKRDFDAIVVECESNILGLCLTCVKLGRLCSDEENCEGEKECRFDDGDWNGNRNNDGNAKSTGRGGWERGQSGRGRC